MIAPLVDPRTGRCSLTPRWLHARRIGDLTHWPAVIEHHGLGGLARYVHADRVRDGYRAPPGFALLKCEARRLYVELVWWLYLPAVAWRSRWQPIALLHQLGLVEIGAGDYYRTARPRGWHRFCGAWLRFWISEDPHE